MTEENNNPSRDTEMREDREKYCKEAVKVAEKYGLTPSEMYGKYWAYPRHDIIIKVLSWALLKGVNARR